MPAPQPLAPYPGLHQLRPLASLDQECHTGARSAFPRLGLRGAWSGPSSQRWQRERLPALTGEMRPLPASHAHPSLQMFKGAFRGSTGIKAGAGGGEGDVARKDGGEPWRGRRGQWNRQGRRTQAASTADLLCDPRYRTALSGPHASICHPRGLGKMVYFTVFAEHLLCAGPQRQSSAGNGPPPCPLEADGLRGRQTSQEFSEKCETSGERTEEKA